MATIAELWAAFLEFHEEYFALMNGESPSIELWAQVGGCIVGIGGDILLDFDTFDEAIAWMKGEDDDND